MDSCRVLRLRMTAVSVLVSQSASNNKETVITVQQMLVPVFSILSLTCVSLIVLFSMTRSC